MSQAVNPPRDPAGMVLPAADRPPPDALGRALLIGGRGLLASLFVLGGVAKILRPELYLAMMDEAGIAPAGPLLAAVAALELGGGLWVASGLRGHAPAALALALHTFAINLLLHDFWHFEGAERIDEISFFCKNLAIAGGLLFVAGAARTRR